MVITRCPDCHARFRVTEGQLKLAQGQVRCGACLCVFDARAHALPEAEADIEAPRPTAADSPSQPDAPAIPSAADGSSVAPETANAPLTATAAVVEPPEAVAETEVTEPQTSSQNGIQAEGPTAPWTATPPVEAAPLPFRAEPIALNSRDRDDNPVATTGWLLLSLLAALALALQLLWFERARLAGYVELHSVYALLCEQVDCTLMQSALTLIDNQGLHLQPHPKYTDALSATVLLENRAAFSQPWPGLLLRFTDLKGRLVAQRTFQPDEYLDTTSVDPLRMPSGQPVQIELELAAPGRRGVSYELKLVPAAPATAK